MPCKDIAFKVTLNLQRYNQSHKSCCRIPSWGARQVAKLLGVKYQLRGHENIVKDSGTIVLMNHQSALDLCGW